MGGGGRGNSGASGAGGFSGTDWNKFGPGGYRQFNETIGPEVCDRPGLFRHPTDCDKFYECYWDKWVEKFTLHVFPCPVVLVSTQQGRRNVLVTFKKIFKKISPSLMSIAAAAAMSAAITTASSAATVVVVAAVVVAPVVAADIVD